MNQILALIRWLGRFVEEGSTGNPSIKRVCLLVAVVALSLAAVILSLAAYVYGRNVGIELGCVCSALAGLAGSGYILGKKVENAAGGPPV